MLRSAATALLFVLTATNTHGDTIDIHLAFVSGALVGTTQTVHLEVAKISQIGDADKYTVESGLLSDLDANISGYSFDETDDVDHSTDQRFPYFSIRRVNANSGEGAGRAFDVILETGAARLELFIFGKAVGGPTSSDETYGCRFRSNLGIAIPGGEGKPVTSTSMCIVSAIVMREDSGDFGGSYTPPSHDPAPAKAPPTASPTSIRWLFDSMDRLGERDWRGNGRSHRYQSR